MTRRRSKDVCWSWDSRTGSNSWRKQKKERMTLLWGTCWRKETGKKVWHERWVEERRDSWQGVDKVLSLPDSGPQMRSWDWGPVLVYPIWGLISTWWVQKRGTLDLNPEFSHDRSNPIGNLVFLSIWILDTPFLSTPYSYRCLDDDCRTVIHSQALSIRPRLSPSKYVEILNT